MSRVLLKWQTQAEITTDYFEVQKSFNKTNWETIAREKSRGVAGSGASYSFTDYSAMNKTVYYRINEVSINNTAAFTAIRKIKPAVQQVAVTIYPNPAKDIHSPVLE
jgi:hypothetical protein